MKKYLLTLSLSIVLMTLAFLGGYFFSKAMYENSGIVLSTETNKDELVYDNITSDSKSTSYYLINMENSKINIYEVESDGRRILIDSYDYAEQLLPEQDRELLKNGIKAYNREEVFEIIENFVS